MNREEFIIPNVRKALIFGCQKSYTDNNKEFGAKSNDGIKEVYSDMEKLETFIEEELEFNECRIYKDIDKKNDNFYLTITDELNKLLLAVSDVGEGN